MLYMASLSLVIFTHSLLKENSLLATPSFVYPLVVVYVCTSALVSYPRLEIKQTKYRRLGSYGSNFEHACVFALSITFTKTHSSKTGKMAQYCDDNKQLQVVLRED